MRVFALSSILALVIGLVSPGWTLPVQAQTQTAIEAGFNINYIIGDEQMTDYLSMSVNRIQQFLDSQTGVLNTYVAPDGRTAAQIIYDAAQASQINPKVLLVTIQKESSMLTRSSFNTDSYGGSQQYYLDWITFYGWCDSCSTGEDKGFTNQVTATARAFRRYLNNIALSGKYLGWGPGVTKTIDCIKSDFNYGREICTPGTKVDFIPVNAATSALYIYTPHPGGNYAFWKLWNSFNFNLQRSYPDGTLLKATGNKDIYLIENGLKRKFSNMSTFLSRYSYNRVITVAPDYLMLYDTGKEIAYANYSLLSSPARGVYLLVNDTIRPIKSGAVFKAAGFQKGEVIKASWDNLNQFSIGPDITIDNIYPSGILLQNKKTGAVFYVKDGYSHPIISGDIYKSQFGQRKAAKVAPEEISKYPSGAPIGFKDGDLVKSKSGGPTYVISHGYRLPIASWAAAKAYGFDKIMKTLIKTSDKALAVHPIGPTLDVDTTNIILPTQ